jgi:hypothetical protein
MEAMVLIITLDASPLALAQGLDSAKRQVFPMHLGNILNPQLNNYYYPPHESIPNTKQIYK